VLLQLVLLQVVLLRCSRPNTTNYGTLKHHAYLVGVMVQHAIASKLAQARLDLLNASLIWIKTTQAAACHNWLLIGMLCSAGAVE